MYSRPKHTHKHSHTCRVSLCVCECLPKLVRHIFCLYAVSMDSFCTHFHREIISCIAMPIHLSATPTLPSHTHTHIYTCTHTLAQLICLFLWRTHGKGALQLRQRELERERQREREKDTYINLYRCAPKSIHRNFISDSLLFSPSRFVFPFEQWQRHKYKAHPARFSPDCFSNSWLGHQHCSPFLPHIFSTIPY